MQCVQRAAIPIQDSLLNMINHDMTCYIVPVYTNKAISYGNMYLFDGLHNGDSLSCSGRTKHQIGNRSGCASDNVFYRLFLFFIVVKLCIKKSKYW